ncbi:CHAT domain-containing protein [Leptolyngbya cf. ectocarpi LEGE 11479]|uniref:CHAT domain-containing protein n=1 Tax=Leptolyngbya cf. ectocarpi LEGE 11479 TaxID=1828722 RepID=A0A928ZWH5_LEPEC|nr:CHAT domain-containing protein [Leptolyngbya ectocarpi]MBE9068727.1 CHAT domain-containing protein [Leptolyngbya cf. ectocarpi LEGE 11479]
MLRSHPRPLTLLLCFLLSLILTVGHGLWLLPTAVAVDSPTVLAQISPQQQGRQLYEAGRIPEAIAIWEQLANTLAAQGDSLNQASVLSNLALAYQHQGNLEQAQTAMAQSLELLHQVNPDKSPEIAGIFAQVWNTQGNLALLRSHPTQALSAFENATKYYTQADNHTGEQRSRINQAQALQSLGFYRRALTILTHANLSLTDGADLSTQVTGLQLLGDLQRMTGNLDASQATLEQGLSAAQNLDDANKMATLYLSLGHTAAAKKESETALSHYQTAAIKAQTLQLQLRAKLSQWSLLNEISDAVEETDALDQEIQVEADALYQRIQADLIRLPVSRITVNARLELVQRQLDKTPQQEQVLKELEIARQQAIVLEDARAESYALGYLGQLYLQDKQWQRAERFLQQALSLAETIKAPDLAYQWHWHLGQLQAQQGRTPQAISSYDHAVNNLQSLRGNLIAVTPVLRFDFQEQIEPVYREWVSLLLATAKNDEPAQQTLLAKARQAIESLQLAELENFFHEPCVPVSQEIDRVIENAAAPTAVLYPIILPDRLEIILKLPQQPLKQYTTQISQTDLESLLKELQYNLLRPWKTNEVQTESKKLYDWVIQPAETALETSQIDTLVFVLDGFLRSIPMAALYDGQQYLVEKYGIALAPGLQLVAPQPLQRQKLATIIAGLSEARHGFSELTSVKDEVDQIQQSTPSHVLFNESFTALNLETAINNTPFPLVHLATHGQFSSDPNETFVLAWDQPIKMNALNRLLRQGEQNRQSAIELLILSACKTAAGDKRAALGLAGVAVQAGARSTLASLWNLDDESGALFANLFYQELQTPNISKAQALRNTQLRLLRDDAFDSIFRRPSYWAPYVLLGNWL